MAYIFQILTSKLEMRALLQLYRLTQYKYSDILQEAELRVGHKLYSINTEFELLTKHVFLQSRCEANICHLYVHTDKTYVHMKIHHVNGVYHLIILEIITKCNDDFNASLKMIKDMFIEFYISPSVIYKSAECKTTLRYTPDQSIVIYGKTYSALYTNSRVRGIDMLSLENSVHEIE